MLNHNICYQKLLAYIIKQVMGYQNGLFLINSGIPPPPLFELWFKYQPDFVYHHTIWKTKSKSQAAKFICTLYTYETKIEFRQNFDA